MLDNKDDDEPAPKCMMAAFGSVIWLVVFVEDDDDDDDAMIFFSMACPTFGDHCVYFFAVDFLLRLNVRDDVVMGDHLLSSPPSQILYQL